MYVGLNFLGEYDRDVHRPVCFAAGVAVRLFALKGYITLMCVTYVLIGGQGPWALAYTRVVAAVLCCRVFPNGLC